MRTRPSPPILTEGKERGRQKIERENSRNEYREREGGGSKLNYVKSRGQREREMREKKLIALVNNFGLINRA